MKYISTAYGKYSRECVCVCVSYWFVYWWHCANLHKSTRRHTNLFYGVDSDKIYNLQWAPSLKAGNRNNKRARVPNNAQVGSTNTRTYNRLASVRCPFYLLLFFFSSLQFLLSLLLLLLHGFPPSVNSSYLCCFYWPCTILLFYFSMQCLHTDRDRDTSAHLLSLTFTRVISKR